jgi:hypothetical protein
VGAKGVKCDWCGKDLTLEEADQPDPFFMEGIVETDELNLCKECNEKRWDDV